MLPACRSQLRTVIFSCSAAGSSLHVPHERSAARDSLLVCSSRIIATCTSRAVDRSHGAFLGVLSKMHHKRSTAGDHVCVFRGACHTLNCLASGQPLTRCFHECSTRNATQAVDHSRPSAGVLRWMSELKTPPERSTAPEVHS